MMDYLSKLTLRGYWYEHNWEIAKQRNWVTEKDSGGVLQCKTLQQYGTYIDKLSIYLPQEPISELSLYQIQSALTKVQEYGRPGGYAVSTMKGYVSCLQDIYKFAQDHAHAYNIIGYLRELLREDGSVFVFCGEPERVKEAAKNKLEKIPSKLHKSISVRQQYILAQFLENQTKEDGRSCGVALALYAGLRPAEIRALNWEDIKSFLDCEQRKYISIYKYRKPDGTLVFRTKTENGYRKIPLHIELLTILNERYEYIKHETGCDIYSYPICCIGNQFDEPCRDYHLSIYAENVMSKLKLTREEKEYFFLDMFAEWKTSESLNGDDHLSMYVLRRNFWTWMEASTRLDDMEKRYLMGHEMHVDDINQREHYNNQDVLMEMGDKLNRYVIDPELRDDLTKHVKKDTAVIERNRGVLFIRLDKETILEGGILNLVITVVEEGSIIEISKLVGDVDLRKGRKRIIPFERMPIKEMPIVNTELSQWRVINQAKKNQRKEVRKKWVGGINHF